MAAVQKLIMSIYTKKILVVSLFVLGLIESRASCFDIFQPNRLYIYNFTGSVEAGARNDDASLRPTNWIITGLFQLQRIDSTTIAAWVSRLVGNRGAVLIRSLALWLASRRWKDVRVE